MAHYAKIENNLVTTIIVADSDFVNTLDGEWIQTSYNTRGGIHYASDGRPDGEPALRKNYAAIGSTYNRILDAFIPSQPYLSWVLDTDLGQWFPPVPMPDDAAIDVSYEWDEPTVSWLKVNNTPRI